jgi:hopanoid C-2 methylase
MRSGLTSRRVLCVFPHYEKSFGTFENAYPLLGVKAFMPPQGLLVITAYLPKHWEVRFIDENVRPASDADYDWADVVMTSGMHIQRNQINAINRRAHSFRKVTVIGGPSVSGCPEHYPEFDYLHVGELGDATDALIQALEISIARPAAQVRLETKERLPLSDFPTPAYELAAMDKYFLANVQFSSGCPYRCEFCDIPELYGRNPRLKTPQQILKELDAIVAGGCVGAVYFVDDNFVGNRKAALELLPHLVEWQKKNKYPVEFACEATLNIVKSPDLLALMREADFWTIFVGIETPDPSALKLISKDHNNTVPVLDAISILNSYGLEVVSGIIMGLDSDTPKTGERILQFIDESQIPILTINLLEALPRTPLYRRLQSTGRLNDSPGRESNVEFLLPYDEVVAMWRRTFQQAFTPEAIYQRFAYQQKHTYPNRVQPPPSGKANARNIVRGFTTLVKLMWTVGVKSDYRRVFWQMAKPALRHLDIEDIIHVSLVSHHLISFAREAARGKQNAAFYSPELIARAS